MQDRKNAGPENAGSEIERPDCTGWQLKVGPSKKQLHSKNVLLAMRNIKPITIQYNEKIVCLIECLIVHSHTSQTSHRLHSATCLNEIKY